MSCQLYLKNGGQKAAILLAHGAGAPHSSDFMQQISDKLADQGLCVGLFNFSYMDEALKSGKRRPPDRLPKLADQFLKAVTGFMENIPAGKPLLIGGKSMGGRVASMLLAGAIEKVQTEHEKGLITLKQLQKHVNGLILLGYPFHPPGKPDKLRTEHLPKIKQPVCLIQGERDKFGDKPFVERLKLPFGFDIFWAPDGDHDLKPRKLSGFTHDQNMNAAAKAATDFIDNLPKA